MFSKACEYGIKAVIYIASKVPLGQHVSVKQIATEIDSPQAFTAKIVQSLVRSGIILSIKGPTGGYTISNKKIQDLNLSEIVLAIDGPSLMTSCILGFKDCNDDKPCPAHNKFSKVRAQFNLMLNTTMIDDLVNRVNNDDAVLRQ